MIPHSFLQELLDRVDIIDVVGQHVQLKKAGANFVGLCPFHNEKSPSFTVSPTKQFYHCFGCGAHGTAISFLIEHLGLPFPEAVEVLAQSLGITVPKEQSLNTFQLEAQKKVNATMTNALEIAENYYRNQLIKSPKASQYLKFRGLEKEIMAHFNIGYAPDGWQNLAQVFDPYPKEVLIESGLVIASEKKENQGKAYHYDRFRDRIIFPIRNERGKTIGFGGRVIEDEQPKYLNSPETPLFTKGNELYGLFEGRSAIREKGFLLVVEGYMDVVVLTQFGFSNAVATLGTACTPIHVKKMVRQTARVIFCFDGDAAGQRAARRALEICLAYAEDNREFLFLFLPKEHDPDSFLRANGASAFSAEIERAMPLSAFLLKEIVEDKKLDQSEGRAKALFDAKPLLQVLPENALKIQIIYAVAEALKISKEEVIQFCQLEKNNSPLSKKRMLPAVERRRVTQNERRALRNLLMFPMIVQKFNLEPFATIIEVGQYPALFEEVIECARLMGENVEFRLLSDFLKRSKNFCFYEEIFTEIMAYDENVRDLILFDSNSEKSQTYYTEQMSLAYKEIMVAAKNMRLAAYSERLNALSNQSQLSSKDLTEFAEISRLQTEIKKNINIELSKSI